MVYREEIKDLFLMPEKYYLAHCISADFALGKGIAVEFNKRFDVKNKLLQEYPKYLEGYDRGDCILEGRILNLVTKERYFQKPTYESMSQALGTMKQICLSHGIGFIAMPTIGAGLDKLPWAWVASEIQRTFQDIDIEIVVCKLS